TAENVVFGETERLRAREFATKLSMRVLSRMWQMLLKGIAEAQGATRPATAAEMVLVRIAYVADMPTPDEAIRMIEQNGGATGVVAASAAPRSVSAPVASAVPPMPARTPTAPRGGAEASAQPQMMAALEAQSVPIRKVSSFPELVALAAEKRDLMTKAALE